MEVGAIDSSFSNVIIQTKILIFFYIILSAAHF